MDTDDLAATIQELKDINDLKQLKSRYCHLVDSGNWDELASLWTEDAECDYSFFGTFKGRDEIVNGFFRDQVGSVSSFNAHMLHNPLIEVDGDSASATWYVTAHTILQPFNKAMMMMGVYHDQYERIEGGWKISSLKVDFKYFTPFDEGWAKTPMWEMPS
ncbi:MAG: nuclear transport factor 2 family protein [Halieaceae bacterium]|jgi:hypothetical protein|nr:nuclear transport factor 2 family protein [Halieaceae bacterium]